MTTQYSFNAQKLLDDMITFVAVLEPNGSIVFVNNTPLIAAGITLDDIKGTKFWDAAWWTYSKQAIANIKADVELCASGKNLLHEIQLATADGMLIWIEYSMHPILDDDGLVEYLVPEGRDITDKKLQEQQMQRLAHYDTLTGLPNRLLFEDRFKQAIVHSKRNKTLLGVCFLDIDNFKPINDNFGHEAGDKLLVEVSNRLTQSIRESDTVSRMGGDEFTLLLGDFKTANECTALVNKILGTLSKPYDFDNNTHHITASCGITLFPKDNSDVDLLIRHADQAMYQAKLGGKNNFVLFDSDTEISSQYQNSFIARVVQAVLSNELVLYFQPKVNMETGEMVGCEALIRWLHPKKGLLSPIDFLPFIQNTDTMVAVGSWVINQACSQLNTWQKEDKRWKLSINIDAYHLMQDSFYEEVELALSKYPNVDPKLLEIEILETIEFSDLHKVSEIIKRCKTLGVSFALDDFGTGYSSLTYLKELPIECLKIDLTFVRDMLVDTQDLALIEGIILLSKAFNKNIIAEGVENKEQSIELLKLGCLYAQGYFYSKPLPIDELINWYENNQIQY